MPQELALTEASITDEKNHQESPRRKLPSRDICGDKCLWNSTCCKTHSEGLAASTITRNNANNTVWLRLGTQNGLHFALGAWDS